MVARIPHCRVPLRSEGFAETGRRCCEQCRLASGHSSEGRGGVAPVPSWRHVAVAVAASQALLIDSPTTGRRPADVPDSRATAGRPRIT